MPAQLLCPTPGYHGDRRLRELVGEFRQRSPEFAGWWDSHDVQETRSRLRRFRHPQHGEQTMRLIVVRAPEFDAAVVVFHIPAQGPDPVGQ